MKPQEKSKTAESDLLRLAEENAAMAEIGRIISSSTDISEVYARFGEVVAKLLPFDRINVTLADLEHHKSETAYAWGIPLAGIEPGSIFHLVGTVTNQVMQEQCPLVSGAKDVHESALHWNLTERQKEVQILSYIAVPLRAKNEIFGILQIQSRELDIYQDTDVRLLGDIASQISGAIANARLYAEVARSEVELRDSEAKLRAVLETAADGILTIDSHGTIESMNSAAQRIFGYSEDELIGKNVSSLMPPTYQRAHDGYLSNYLLTGQTGIIGIGRELEGVRKDGSIFPMDLSVSEIELDGRRSFTGIVRDITERKKSEDELRQLATIVESINDPIIATDNQQLITVWNRAAEALYGYTAQDAVGQSLALITPPHVRPLQTANAATALAGKLIAKHDSQKITKTGRMVDVSIGGAPIFNRDGEVVGAVGTHRDMTDQKRAERALRESEERYSAKLLEEKNRAEESQLQKTQQLQTIFEIAQALAGSRDLRTKAEQASRIVREHLDADVITMRMVNEQGDALNLLATDGLEFSGVENPLSLAVNGFSQRAFKGGHSVTIGDYTVQPEANREGLAYGIRSVCSIALLGADGPTGVLSLGSRNAHHFDEEKLELLEAISSGIASLFESARLSENLEQTQKEMAVADEIARILTTTLDMGAAYGDFFAEVKKLVDFDLAGVMLVNEDENRFTPAFLTDPDRVPFVLGQAYDLAGTILDQMIEGRKAIVVPDLSEAAGCWACHELLKVDISSLVMTPLMFEGRIIGGFILLSSSKDGFGERESIILDRLASQVAPSVRNAMLYQEADQYALALDSIGEAVAFLDLDLKIKYVNRAFEETYGYSANEVRGQGIWAMTDDDASTPTQALDIVEQSIKGSWSGEMVSKSKSGKKFDILLTIAPVKDKNGQVIGRISVSRDITERKKSEARLTEQSRLASIGELAAGVAHEMNNPLTSILLCSQLLTESNLPEDTLADLAIISNAARRAAKIVHSLLLFARREDPKPVPMTLDLVVEQALELKANDFRKNNISTVLDFEKDLPNSLVDSHQMSQVIVNILNNAEDALVAQKGGGEITIKIEEKSGAVVLEIRDDGPGIEPDLLHKIFEPFYTTKAPGEGTGLGLSICHGIVQQHGGEMWAASKKGSGMSFFIQLPISKAIGISQPDLNQDAESGIQPMGRLLVVDDEIAIRQLVAKGLSNDFEIVDQAQSGEAALDMIRASNYDCILLDLKMPGISGMEVFEKAANYQHGLTDRIIIMTGDTASPETASFLSDLSNIVIHKPFTMNDVRLNIGKVLEGR